MIIDIRPATAFDDVAAVIGPSKPTSNVCFCLNYRLGAESKALREPARSAKVRELCEHDPPPGILAYVDDVPAAWAALHPRRDTSFARSRVIPHVDDLDVWSLWCFRVRPGFRKLGLMHTLAEGAVGYARERGAPAIEGYPVDNGGARINQTMMYAGTRSMFERAGFVKAADTASQFDGHPRVLMRLDLR